MSKNVIIVGPPRSGTSLTAAVFAKKGYYVGAIESAAMRDGDDNNPYGYFEADELIARNVGILERGGFSFHNTWRHEPITADVIERLAVMPPSNEERAFVQACGAHRPWMWKDPRLCFTLPVWARAIDPRTTVIVVVRRATEDIYRSFQRMGWCEDGAMARRRTVERIELHARHAEDSAKAAGMPHVCVDYADYLAKALEVAERLGELCGLRLVAEDLNVQPALSHSSARGRFSARLRRSLDRGALRSLKAFRPMVPRKLLSALFPEKKHQSLPK